MRSALPFLLLSYGAVAAQPVLLTDGAGREVRVPAKVERVYAAGPPASMLVFAIAPDKLIGWTRAFRPDEAVIRPDTLQRLYGIDVRIVEAADGVHTCLPDYATRN